MSRWGLAGEKLENRENRLNLLEITNLIFIFLTISCCLLGALKNQVSTEGGRRFLPLVPCFDTFCQDNGVKYQGQIKDWPYRMLATQESHDQ